MPPQSPWVSRIIATTNKSLKALRKYSSEEGIMEILPQPSKAFLEKYCKLGGVEDVMVGYKDMSDEYGCDPAYYGDDTFQPKVDSHNTITIHPVKKEWTKEEVLKLAESAMKYPGLPVSQEMFDGWCRIFNLK